MDVITKLISFPDGLYGFSLCPAAQASVLIGG